MAFFNRNNTQTKPNTLKGALKAMQNEEKASIRMAESYLPVISNAIDEAESELNKCLNKCTALHMADASIVNKLNAQLKKIGTDYKDAYYQTWQFLRLKKEEKSTFNITLFGKTMAGKSTLMEILTHGDGRSIGKGGQRTTRDVRRYEWNGLTITDVPGINAFNGKEDEDVAIAAARTADLIIFILNDGAPESIEADWLCKLKNEDKPVLCLLNCKQTIADEFDREDFLANPEAEVFNEVRLRQITDQFNEFVRKNLPNERITVYPVHLQSEFMAQQPGTDPALAERLHKVSRFDSFVGAIIGNVAHNGLFLRQKAYLVQIDSPLYKLYGQMLDNCAESYDQSQLVYSRQQKFQAWQNTFNEKAKEDLHSKIDQLFDDIDRQIPSFVDSYIENNLSQRWKGFLEQKNINGRLENLAKLTAVKAQKEINNLFEDLGKDLKFSARLKSSLSWRGYGVTNWKKFWGWTSAGLGAIGFGVGLLFSGPIGWIVGGIGALFGLFGWFSDSREEKLRRERNRAKNDLQESTNKMRKNAHSCATKFFFGEIVKGMEREADKRFKAMTTSMLSLTNTQRSLAIKYMDAHIKVTTDMIREALRHMGTSEDYIRSITKVARIPGKQMVIITDYFQHGELPFEAWKLCQTIGSQEKITALTIYESDPAWQKAKTLFKELGVYIPISVKTIEDRELGRQNIAYIANRAYSDKETMALDLAEQITKIHFIKKA